MLYLYKPNWPYLYTSVKLGIQGIRPHQKRKPKISHDVVVFHLFINAYKYIYLFIYQCVQIICSIIQEWRIMTLVASSTFLFFFFCMQTPFTVSQSISLNSAEVMDLMVIYPQYPSNILLISFGSESSKMYVSSF